MRSSALFGGGGLAALALCFLFCGVALIAAEVPDARALALSAVAAVLPAGFYVLAILWLDRYEREPWALLAGSFLWGAVIATGFALVVNTGFQVMVAVVTGEALAGVVGAVFLAPLVEEALKGSALLLLVIFLRHEYDDTLDGIVYGALIGLGFAMTENLLYFGRAILAEGAVGLAKLFLLRAVYAGLAHSLFTATTGAGLGYARTSRSNSLRVFVPAGCFALAVVQHGAWNLVAGIFIPALVGAGDDALYLLVVAPLQSLLLAGPGFIALSAAALLAGRREAVVIREQLMEEVVGGVVAPDEYRALPSSRRRLQEQWRVLRTHGPRAWLDLRALYQAETELAFRKWHTSLGDPPPRGAVAASEERYRAQIRHLRARLAAASA